MWAVRLATLMALCVSCVATAPAGRRDDTLVQIMPHSLESHLKAGNLVFTAFVNPVLPHSARFHPVLHELRTLFRKDSNVVISFADVGAHRAFASRYGLRSLPALLLFLPVLTARQPIPLLYSANRTAAEYAAEIRQYVVAQEPGAALSAGAYEAVEGALQAQHRREWEEAVQALQRRDAAAAAATAAVGVTAAGEAAPALGTNESSEGAVPVGDAETAGASEGVTEPADGLQPTEGAGEAAAPSPYEPVLARLRSEAEFQRRAAELAATKVHLLESIVGRLAQKGTGGVTGRLHARLGEFMALPLQQVEAGEPGAFAPALAELHLLHSLVASLQQRQR
jgi:hypothetical protein